MARGSTAHSLISIDPWIVCLFCVAHTQRSSALKLRTRNLPPWRQCQCQASWYPGKAVSGVPQGPNCGGRVDWSVRQAHMILLPIWSLTVMAGRLQVRKGVVRGEGALCWSISPQEGATQHTAALFPVPVTCHLAHLADGRQWVGEASLGDRLCCLYGRTMALHGDGGKMSEESP